MTKSAPDRGSTTASVLMISGVHDVVWGVKVFGGYQDQVRRRDGKEVETTRSDFCRFCGWASCSRLHD